MKRTQWALAVTAGVVAVASFLVAQDAPNRSRQTDEQAIRQASQAFAQAFAKGDSRAVAALWTEEGEYIDEGGEPVRGRAALGKAYADFFAKRSDAKAEAKTDAIRFVGKDAAIEEGTFTVTSKNVPANVSRFSALYLRQDGRWLMAVLKEWGDDTVSPPTLQDLAWLIGTWESEGADLKARTTYEWAENKASILARYAVTPKKEGEKPVAGTQVLRVNPATGTIYAWTFDADGGVGEAAWAWDGDHWVIESFGTLADGSPTTARNTLTRSGDDAFTWRSVQRTVGRASLPDIGPVTVKRVK